MVITTLLTPNNWSTKLQYRAYSSQPSASAKSAAIIKNATYISIALAVTLSKLSGTYPKKNTPTNSIGKNNKNTALLFSTIITRVFVPKGWYLFICSCIGLIVPQKVSVIYGFFPTP